MENKCYTNIFYFNHINSIGGIETFFYQLAKKYQDNDITIMYKTGDINQINRLKQYIRVIKYKGEKIKCKKAFFNFNLEVIENIEAEEYIQIIHGDYKAMKVKPNTHPKINKYISVSEIVKESFKGLTALDSKVIYNPIDIEEPKRVLFLISATRLTSDKGKERMIKLADMLDKENVPYMWLIFTDDTKAINNPNIVYMKPRIDIDNYIARADYLVQLSDAEGYCYSVVESLMLGTPVIVTDMPVIKEIGVNKDNGIILNFDLSNVDQQEVYNKKFNFKYEPPKSNWGEEIIKSKSTYKEELNMRFKVEALPIWEERNITDSSTGKVREAGEQWEVDKERLEVLLGDNPYEKPFVKLVEEIKEETTTIKDSNCINFVEALEKETTKEKPIKKSTTKKQPKKK